MTNPTQQAARLLVKCGYCEVYRGYSNQLVHHTGEGLPTSELCEPFADTLEGRRQLDALEDYLTRKEDELWICSFPPTHPPSPPKRSYHQWRQDRVRWCLEQLGERDERD